MGHTHREQGERACRAQMAESVRMADEHYPTTHCMHKSHTVVIRDDASFVGEFPYVCKKSRSPVCTGMLEKVSAGRTPGHPRSMYRTTAALHTSSFVLFCGPIEAVGEALATGDLKTISACKKDLSPVGVAGYTGGADV